MYGSGDLGRPAIAQGGNAMNDVPTTGTSKSTPRMVSPIPTHPRTIASVLPGRPLYGHVRMMDATPRITAAIAITAAKLTPTRMPTIWGTAYRGSLLSKLH